ncbi:MAG: stage II sporulation protein D [Bacillota bacterium]|nr:stage II sporulation protein D [Bacillota bacterium]
MKKIAFLILLMLIVVIVGPLLIVKGCGSPKSGKSVQPPENFQIRVYVASENKVRKMGLEEYVKGVVAKETPANFEPEALKAQAVAARTYAFGRLEKVYASKNDEARGADICTDPGDCQAWISKEAAMKSWGIFSASKNWNKIDKAVNDTKGSILVYNGQIANPVFHSNGGGKTENSEDVWEGVAVPYLRSVVSEGDQYSPEYKNTVVIKNTDFSKKMKGSYPSFKLTGKDTAASIKILEYSAGGRAKNVNVGNITMKGTDFRKLFNLKSANFKVQNNGKSSIKITTYGNGHGVGMSQWGANYLAKKGGSYDEILKYYYTGIQLSNVSAYSK